ncbi:MAG TPA: 30S ribosomal protein S15 [Membranihabitans sp.]|nr:30S ribosomal protein S15 [Membranihabitans sp.]
MAVYLSKEKKQEIFKKYGGNETNTGSPEAQIALFTERIKGLSDHLKTNEKDHSSRKALLSIVGKRKKLLSYLAKKDIEGYRSLIQDLGLRK